MTAWLVIGSLAAGMAIGAAGMFLTLVLLFAKGFDW